MLVLGKEGEERKRGIPRKSSMYKYREDLQSSLFSLSSFHWIYIISLRLNKPITTNFLNNKMHFNLAIGTVLSTVFMWTAYGALVETNLNMTSLIEETSQKVVCQGGLSDTNICEQQYCGCSGNTIFCLPGTTCLSTCVCSAWSHNIRATTYLSLDKVLSILVVSLISEQMLRLDR